MGCELCENYTGLKEPRSFGEEVVIHGICFKHYMKNGMTSIYPVYIPHGKCRDFVKKAGIKMEENLEGQMTITDFPEVLP